jgi:hypothetical protein
MATNAAASLIRGRLSAALFVAAALGLLAGAAWTLRTRPAPRPRLEVRLEPLRGVELWSATSATPMASKIRFRGLDAQLEAAHESLVGGLPDHALLQYEAALQRWGEHPLVLAGLGRLFLALRDRPKLKAVLRRLEQLEPGLPELRLLRAELELLEGHNDSSEALLVDLKDSGPPVQARARLLLAALRFERGEIVEARRLAESVAETELDLPDSRTAYKRLIAALGKTGGRRERP